MNPGLVVKLRPTGPWRVGPDSGARNRVDAVYHSDSLYGALCSAMARLGLLEDWLDATARGEEGPAVAFSSCFPFVDDIRFVAPPRSIWPPTSPALLSARVRWKSARFIPLTVVEGLLAGRPPDENQWNVDAPSECLVPASVALSGVPSGPGGPFRTNVRWSAAIDRLSGASERYSTACLEYRAGAGLWSVASFDGDAAREKWAEPVKAAFRWLADAGFGGEKSRGWGRSDAPEFIEGSLPGIILNQPSAPENGDASGAEQVSESPAAAEPPLEAPAASNGNHERPYWLLSLFTPAAADTVDWSRGNYTLVARAGRVQGSGELKRNLQMVAEGSVLYAREAPRGAAPDVAPEGFAYPAFRAGFAVSIPLPEAV